MLTRGTAELPEEPRNTHVHTRVPWVRVYDQEKKKQIFRLQTKHLICFSSLAESEESQQAGRIILTTETKRNLHRICRSKQKLMTPLSSNTAQDRIDRTDTLSRFQNKIVCIGRWFVLLTKPLKCTRDCKSVPPSVLISRTHSLRSAAPLVHLLSVKLRVSPMKKANSFA